MKTPFELWKSGEGSFKCLDNAVEHWHSAPESPGGSLSDYLGMTKEQYSLYVLDSAEFERKYPYGCGR